MRGVDSMFWFYFSVIGAVGGLICFVILTRGAYTNRKRMAEDKAEQMSKPLLEGDLGQDFIGP